MLGNGTDLDPKGAGWEGMLHVAAKFRPMANSWYSGPPTVVVVFTQNSGEKRVSSVGMVGRDYLVGMAF